MEFYLKSKEETFKELNSNENGLSTQEAEKRLEENGKNKLKESKKDSLFKKMLKQISDPMILMLLGAATIQMITTILSGENDFVDFFIILAVVIINTILGLIQESKAENAIDSLM